MLLQGSTERNPVGKEKLWTELASLSDLEKMPSPRILNTHLRVDMFPRQMKEKWTKIVAVVRNPKDVAVSYYHHLKGRVKNIYEGRFEDYLVNYMEGNGKITFEPGLGIKKKGVPDDKIIIFFC